MLVYNMPHKHMLFLVGSVHFISNSLSLRINNHIIVMFYEHMIGKINQATTYFIYNF